MGSQSKGMVCIKEAAIRRPTELRNIKTQEKKVNLKHLPSQKI